MAIKNEAARLFFAISALILVTMLSAPQTETSTPTNSSLKREIASFEGKVADLRSGKELSETKNKKVRKTAEKKTSRKLVKKT